MTGSTEITDSEFAIVTGATGGMGRSCARLVGRRMPLILTDIAAGPLDDFAEELRSEGLAVTATLAGDLTDSLLADRLVQSARCKGRIAIVVHTAGLSPALAGWQDIIRTNVLATERLLRALEKDQEFGMVAVLIASIAGHLAPARPEIDVLLAQADLDELVDRLGQAIGAIAGGEDAHGCARAAYAQSKRAVIRMCELRAADWGTRNGRILSVSPGIIATPMGRAEVEGNNNAAQTLEATPAGRWGSSIDIAEAVDFLVSDKASFITGCDLRIDGGVVPVLRCGSTLSGWTAYAGGG